ncbi:hypothetical protein ACJMK2_042779 [Sinanodonta woodiana]|uniref:beta-N-acetylhexosaminidase n=1 Tax=Sinanodonta woodiana TaxID=1069815 RepID=A0ABD3VXP1_SINWO
MDNLLHDGERHRIEIQLTNKGLYTIITQGWHLYFHSFFMIEPDFLPNSNGHLLENDSVKVFHDNGMLFRLELLPAFGYLRPGISRTINLTAGDWAVSKTDIPGNWYVAALNLLPRVLNATDLDPDPFVEPFVEPNQWKRYKADRYDPFSPSDRYERYNATDLGSEIAKYVIIPSPDRLTLTLDGYLTVDDTWVIAASDQLMFEASYLGDKLGLNTSHIPKSSKVIFLELDDTEPGLDHDESYVLKCIPCANIVSIKGKRRAGVFYGVQTLLQILASKDGGHLDGLVITDKPRFGYRGLHVDVARNFQTKEDVMRTMEAMAMYKLNKLHLHLSDDEGWRLEIPGLPDLTELGGKRCHDLTESECIIPQLGSGPDTSTRGSGFYTVQDYKDILARAAKLHIEVIPELAMPSHAHAAIKAMEKRNRQVLKNRNVTDANLYHLRDTNDTSVYLSVQMFNDNTINPCIESTYRFVKHVVGAVKAMHEGINELKIFHFGGNNVPDGAWANSSACRELFSDYRLNATLQEELSKGYFLNRVSDLILQENLKMGGYEDAYILNDAPYLNGTTDVISYQYQNLWEWGKGHWAYMFANSGYAVSIQGMAWSETILTSEHLDYMTFPRVLALAERAWHKADWETIGNIEKRRKLIDDDWQMFATALGYRELKRLDDLGVKYRVPPPGAKLDGKTVSMKSIPGLNMQYSEDAQVTWTEYLQPFYVQTGQKLHLRTLSADGKRRSRVVVFVIP